MQVWPAIDLRGGKCVRLQQGDYTRETVFSADPVAMARHWVLEGAQRLHIVDLDGARDGQQANRASIQAILGGVRIPCQLGGGVRDEATIRQLLSAGIHRVVVGTRALRDEGWFREMCRLFPDRLALGIDARDGRVATDGWLQTSDVAATELARQFVGEPLAAVIYTDISTDGMLAGPNLKAMREMIEAVNLPIIASGGVTTADDVASLKEIGAAGCIIGRALYEQRMTLAAAMDAAGDV